MRRAHSRHGAPRHDHLDPGLTQPLLPPGLHASIQLVDRIGDQHDRHVRCPAPRVEQAAGELLAEELRLAQLSLSEITGAFTADDLLGEIFASFCIGK